MRIQIVALLGILTGCGPGDTGVWAVYLPAESVIECESVITHNFVDAYEPEEEIIEEGDWTIETDSVMSDSLTFVQIEEYGDGQAILFIGAEAYPGVSTDAGWSFSWEGSTESSNNEDHTSGYAFSSTNSSISTTTIVFNIDGDTATGTIGGESDSQRTWSESDTWDPKVVGYANGRIPAQNYLLVDTDKETGIPATNRAATENCSGDCSLELVTSCAGEDSFTAARVHYSDESVYEYVDEAGQGAGF